MLRLLAVRRGTGYTATTRSFDAEPDEPLNSSMSRTDLLADTLVGLVVAAAAEAKLLLKNDENGKYDNSGREKS
jgi:hypothetical protein